MIAPDLAALSGLELLRWMTAEGAPDRPSIGRLLGMRFDELEHGRGVMSVQTRPDFATPLGTVHGGIAATLLDSVVGCAVHTTPAGSVARPSNSRSTTSVRSRRAAGPSATGTVIHAGRRVATAEGRVVDDRDRLVAHATTTCMILGS